MSDDFVPKHVAQVATIIGATVLGIGLLGLLTSLLT